jgi:hypothetical protein
MFVIVVQYSSTVLRQLFQIWYPTRNYRSLANFPDESLALYIGSFVFKRNEKIAPLQNKGLWYASIYSSFVAPLAISVE